MANVLKRIMVVLLVVAGLSLISGCTDWEKKYNGLEVMHQNLLRRHELCQSDLDLASAGKSALIQDLNAAKLELAGLQREAGTGDGIWGALGPEFDVPKGTITVTLQNTLLFEAGKAELKKSVISELDQIASVLLDRYRDKDVNVVGHTDSDPIL